MNYQANAAKFGNVTHGTAILALTQQAYASNHQDSIRYYASAIDAEGNEYRVAWDTTAAWDAAEDAYRADPNESPNDDESLACDWSCPAEILAL